MPWAHGAEAAREARDRRNLTPEQFRYHLGRRYNRTKKSKAEAGAKGGASKAQNDPCLPESTAEALAAEHGVSPATVKRDRRHLGNAGQRSMIVAMMFPSGRAGRQEDPAARTAESAGLSARRLQQARQVLAADAVLAEKVRAGSVGLDAALS
jgi:hypothetical protein